MHLGRPLVSYHTGSSYSLGGRPALRVTLSSGAKCYKMSLSIPSARTKDIPQRVAKRMIRPAYSADECFEFIPGFRLIGKGDEG